MYHLLSLNNLASLSQALVRCRFSLCTVILNCDKFYILLQKGFVFIGAMPVRPTVPNAPVFFRVGERQHQIIPPKAFWHTQFSQKDPAFVKFNFSISSSAILGVYGRKSVPPTLVQFEFFEVVEGKTIPSRSRRSAGVSAVHKLMPCFTLFLSDWNWGKFSKTVSLEILVT